MSGVCSAHIGHEPQCPACAASTPEQALASETYADGYRHGVMSGADAVAEWLDGAQWNDDGQPMPTDALAVANKDTLSELARMVRGRFVNRA